MPGDAALRNSGISHFTKAQMLSKHKQYDEAITEYRLHLKAHPKSAAAYNNIGFAYYDNKDLDKAIENHKKSLELNPELANGYFGLALAYEKKGDKKKALANWKEFTKRSDPADRWHKKAMEHIKELTKNKKQKTH
jgi:tetratricopeptide (TPR) repeat protein